MRREKVEVGSLRDSIWGEKLYPIIFRGAFPIGYIERSLNSLWEFKEDIGERLDNSILRSWLILQFYD